MATTSHKIQIPVAILSKKDPVIEVFFFQVTSFKNAYTSSMWLALGQPTTAQYS